MSMSRRLLEPAVADRPEGHPFEGQPGHDVVLTYTEGLRELIPQQGYVVSATMWSAGGLELEVVQYDGIECTYTTDNKKSGERYAEVRFGRGYQLKAETWLADHVRISLGLPEHVSDLPTSDLTLFPMGTYADGRERTLVVQEQASPQQGGTMGLRRDEEHWPVRMAWAVGTSRGDLRQVLEAAAEYVGLSGKECETFAGAIMIRLWDGERELEIQGRSGEAWLRRLKGLLGSWGLWWS